MPFSAALFTACGALLRAAVVHCAFLVGSVQRAKLDAAPETLPELAAAMQASQLLAAGAGVGVAGFTVPVAGLPGSTGGAFSTVAVG